MAEGLRSRYARWRVTNRLIVTWTLSMAALFLTPTIENDVWHIEIMLYRAVYYGVWLAGVVPFGIIWILGYLRGDSLNRETPRSN